MMRLTPEMWTLAVKHCALRHCDNCVMKMDVSEASTGADRTILERCALSLHNAAVRHIQKALDAVEKEEDK